MSGTGVWPQKMSPSLLTEMMMFSGLVWRAMLVSFGSATGTVCVTTGMVIRKMISSTSITSTSGVVLIVETTSSSSLDEPTVMAMAALRSDGQRVAAAALMRGAPISTPCRSAPKRRTDSIVTLLRRTSQL